MAITFHCEHCGKKIEAKDAAGGNWGACPACHNKVYVPDLSAKAGEELKLVPIDENEVNKQKRLIGKENETSKIENLYAFNGIHIVSNRIFKNNLEVRFRGILEIYFELIQKKGVTILGFDTGDCTFKDIGKIENLE